MILAEFTSTDGNRQKPRATVSVARYSNAAMGGPQAATIALSGPEADVWQAIDMLAWDVQLFDEAHDWRWGGFVESVQVNVGTLSYGVSLSSMANRIQAIYTFHTVDANGNDQSTQEATLWAGDTESIATFGTFESRLTFGDSTEKAAEAYRDSILSLSKLPIPTVELAFGGREATATLECRGYWSTLKRRYYSAPMLTYGTIAAEPVNQRALRSTGLPAYQRLGEQINVPAGSALAAATFTVQKEGNPTGLLRCELITSTDPLTSGSYTVVATSTINLADLPDDQGPTEEGGEDPPPADPIAVTFNFPNTVIPSAAIVLIALSRLGATTSETNLINVSFSPAASGTQGLGQLNDGSWATMSSTGHALFQLTLTRETTAMIAQRVLNHDPGNGAIGDYAPFIESAFIEQDSGIYASPYEDGQSRLQDVLLNLLNMGSMTAARLLATVTRDRVLIVSPEPLKTDPPAYEIGRDGQLRNARGVPIDKSICPAGVWVQLVGVIPTTSHGAQLVDASRLFIEECEYDCINDELIPQVRGQSSPWSIGG